MASGVNVNNQKSCPRKACAGMALLCTVMFTGCMTIEQMAPPVDDAVVLAGSGYGHDAESLKRGRGIYLDQCTRCHTVEPINRYSMDQWQSSLSEMSEEASLNPRQTSDVSAYVLTIRQMLDEAPNQSPPGAGMR